MRNVTPEDVKSEKRLLGELSDAWGRLNKRHINIELRSSLYTKLVEVAAHIKVMETQIRKKEILAKRILIKKPRGKKIVIKNEGKTEET